MNKSSWAFVIAGMTKVVLQLSPDIASIQVGGDIAGSNALQRHHHETGIVSLPAGMGRA